MLQQTNERRPALFDQLCKQGEVQKSQAECAAIIRARWDEPSVRAIVATKCFEVQRRNVGRRSINLGKLFRDSVIKPNGFFPDEAALGSIREVLNELKREFKL